MSGSIQLTYTSYDDPKSSRGGWQVKEASADLTEHDLQHALTLVCTGLDLVEAPSAFPSREEIGALPRRMLATVDTRGTAYVVHTSYAGPDASGRHGNVFNHVLVLPNVVQGVLDRQPRPVEWWRSAAWRTPYGPEAVRTDPPLLEHVPTGRVITREAVGRFLAQGRPASLGLMLDAVEAALGGGAKVVLAMDDQDEAVLWMAAVSFLAPAPVQRDLSFSTYERVHVLQSGVPSALVSVVPQQDAADVALLPNHRLVDPHLADASSGTGTWARLGKAVASTGTGASERLLALDELTALNPGATEIQRLWPLALAVAESAEAESGWAEALSVLLQVPLDVVDDEDTREVVRGITSLAAGNTADSARAALVRAVGAGGASHDHIVRIYVRYVELLVSEPENLLGPWPPFLPRLDQPVDTTTLSSLTQMALRALSEAGTHDEQPDRAVQLLRLLDLVHLLGVGPAVHGEASLSAAAEEAAAVLTGSSAEAVVSACGPLTHDAALLISASLGERLRTAPLPSLYAGVASWLDQSLGEEPHGLVRAIREELLMARALSGDSARAKARTVAMAVLSDRWEPGAAPAVRAARAATAAGGPLDIEEVAETLRLTTGHPQAEVCALARQPLQAAPLGSPPAVALAKLLLADVRDGLPPDVQHLATVHRLATADWWQAGRDRWIDAAELAVSGTALYFDVTVPEALIASLRPHVVAAAVRTAAWDPPPDGDVVQDHVLARLQAVAPLLPDLTVNPSGSLEPLVSMLLAHDDLAGYVLDVVASANSVGADEPASLLTIPLDEQDQEELSRTTLAEAAVERFLARVHRPRTWLARRLVKKIDDLGGLPVWAEDLLPIGDTTQPRRR